MDRWEKMARKMYRAEEKRPWVWNEARATHQVAKLLRQQHRRVVRLVQQQLAGCQQAEKRTEQRGERTDAFGYRCRIAQCQDILTQLNQRKK
jgi:hypothetical protein